MALYVRLKQFDGPLDLLLHLIGKAKIDIKDIFVSQITEQFIEAVRTAPDFDPEEASEFIAMAATLVEIKSRALLPRPPKPEEDDPEQVLIARLMAYKQLKESADTMAVFEKSALQVFGKLPEEIPLPPPTLEIEGLTLDALWQALLRVAERAPKCEEDTEPAPQDIRRDCHTVEGCMKTIQKRLRAGATHFEELFEGKPNREELVTLFIALLELLRLGKAYATQSDSLGVITLHPGRRKAVGSD
jgi:segregation and condensation protein A